MSAGQASALTRDAVAEVVRYAKSVSKLVAFEKLDLSFKRSQLDLESPRRSRMLSSLAYGRFQEYLVSRGQRERVVVGVNLAFSSDMGRVKYMRRNGLSVHQSAAAVLARRMLGCSEDAPSEGSVLLDDGGYVTFTVPVGKRLKHVWSLWGAMLGQLRAVLAARHRRRRRERFLYPARAPSRVVISSVYPGGIPGRESSWADGGRHGWSRVFREGWFVRCYQSQPFCNGTT